MAGCLYVVLFEGWTKVMCSCLDRKSHYTVGKVSIQCKMTEMKGHVRRWMGAVQDMAHGAAQHVEGRDCKSRAHKSLHWFTTTINYSLRVEPLQTITNTRRLHSLMFLTAPSHFPPAACHHILEAFSAARPPGHLPINQLSGCAALL